MLNDWEWLGLIDWPPMDSRPDKRATLSLWLGRWGHAGNAPEGDLWRLSVYPDALAKAGISRVGAALCANWLRPIGLAVADGPDH